MLNYPIFNSGAYILNYYISEDQTRIIVNYAGNVQDVIPNTDENINNIQTRMKNQVTKNHCVPRVILLAVGTGVACFGVSNLLGINDPIIKSQIANGCITAVGAGLSIYQIPFISDRAKNMFFIKNDSLINNGLEMEEHSLQEKNKTTKMSKKGRKTLRKALYEKDCLDINDIDEMSLSDLKTLKANITRFNEVSFEYPEEGKSLELKK